MSDIGDDAGSTLSGLASNAVAGGVPGAAPLSKLAPEFTALAQTMWQDFLERGAQDIGQAVPHPPMSR